MQYGIIASTDCDKMQVNVNDALAKGWKLQGGIAVCMIDGQKLQMAQAIIKEEAEGEEDTRI